MSLLYAWFGPALIATCCQANGVRLDSERCDSNDKGQVVAFAKEKYRELGIIIYLCAASYWPVLCTQTWGGGGPDKSPGSHSGSMTHGRSKGN